MVKIEIDSTEGPIFCPFCGAGLITENGFEPPCPHTLYMCLEDGGIEYCSPELDENELQGKIDEDGMDQATDDISGDKVIKFALYGKAPSSFAVYVGLKSDLPPKNKQV